MGRGQGASSNAARLLILLGAALSACGAKAELEGSHTPRDTSALFASGTRLKAHYLDGGGGARELLDFYDSELQVSCQFVESPSGQYHCLPTTRTTTYFDADCSEPAYARWGSCGANTGSAGLLVSSLTSDCDAPLNGYALVEERPVSTLYARVGDACVALGSSPTTAWSLERQPLSRFVAGTLSLVGAAGGLQAGRVTGEDGAFDNVQLMAAGEPCSEVSVQGTLRCMPGHPAFIVDQSFADASCADSRVAEAALSEVDRCAGRRAAYVVDGKSENCIVKDTVYQALDGVGQVFGLNGAGNCVASPTEDSLYPFYRLGAELSAAAAPAIEFAHVGEGALTIMCQTDRDGTPILEPNPNDLFRQFWLLKNGTKCSALFTDPNGTLRCIPFSFAISAAVPGDEGPFSDSGCTQRVQLSSSATCTDAVTGSQPYFTETAGTACNPVVTRAYATEAYSGPLYQQLAETCTPYQALSTERRFIPGAEVDLASFPAITDTTEP